ncbi:hypothetical protein JCM24511_06527 [Saitozyma sp. JCM 24511]|uniref:Large ribosomal subunit protein mL43 n=1 Tax=Saitozyma podzolica TaxID=1890683 RepID=A0A427YLD8_9TREE|nr:hypothetical protein EHS25_009294 [Saitozyma podzolica]GFZ48778.1 hypothetical protein JCM24511_06527 [Saitozyma sp. JCM 24511]
MPRLVPLASAIPRSVSVPGYRHFLTPLRKLILDYDPLSASQNGIRAFLRNPLMQLARENPDVEIVVRRLRRGKAAVLRGHYVNGRDKVICVNGLETNEVANKVDILLNSSGAKIKSLKNLTLEAAPGGESARGVWSALHDQAKEGGGYRI